MRRLAYPRPSLPARGFSTYTESSASERGKHERTDQSVFPIYPLELLRNLLRPVWTSVVHNDDLPFYITVHRI